MKRLLLAVGAASLVLLLGACDSGDGDGRLVEVDLTAEIVDWTVVDGEVVEVWGYNGEYPGPLIEAAVGDTIRVTLTNNLPEGTTIHWHGLEVPNDQDGVPGITQPIIEPGQTYTYEFEATRAGTTMYHTHANTVRQLARGLVGPLVIREQPLEQGTKYDKDFTVVLHEIDGLFTMNGRAFPATLEDPNTLMQVETGERILVRFINAGQQHHPMHLHGHQFKVVAKDSNTLDDPYWVNTVDVAPGETVDVEVVADNPGTWTFHCHVLPHVTNRGEYPGGMLTVLDYTDHTSYFEGAPAPPQPANGGGTAAPVTTTTAAPPPVASGTVEVAATEFAFRPDVIAVEPGQEVTISLRNDGAVLHNLEITELGVLVEADPGLTAEVTFTVPDDFTGPLEYWCNIAGHREAGMVGSLVAGGA